MRARLADMVGRAVTSHCLDCSHKDSMRAFSLEGVVVTSLASVALAVGILLPLVPFYPGIACPLRAVTGIPCPSCGMTGSIQSCLTLDFARAMAQNPGGVLLLTGAVVALILRPREIRVPLVAGAAAVFSLWIFQLVRFGVIP